MLRNGKGEGCYATAVQDIELMAGGGRYRAGWLDACWRAVQTISRAVNPKTRVQHYGTPHIPFQTEPQY